jgi:DNA invertase Pin-like site-specific DNA recombinase
MAAPARRAALYVRVSTAKKTAQANADTGERAYEQNPTVQLEYLESVVQQRGWSLVATYTDRDSGAKDKRPGLESLMADAHRAKFDVVVVWRFNRFARSARRLVVALEEFRGLGIDFVSTQEQLDTSTPMGRAMFTIIAAMAELERDNMRENIMAGMAHAAKHGTKSGKPPGRPRRIVDARSVLQLWEEGHGMAKIGKLLNVSSSTAWRAFQKVRPKPGLAGTDSTLVGGAIKRYS